MKLIAHACGPTVFPSNTVLSAREAMRSGADLIELDLQLTSDGRLAVFHDKDLMKKYGDARRCAEVSALEFSALRRREDPACPGYLLDDFFICGVEPILLHHGIATVEPLLDLIEQYGYEDKVVFGVHHREALPIIRRRLPNAKILGFIPNPDETEFYAANGASYIRLWERWLTPENIRRVKDSGCELWVMTGGPETNFRVGRPDADAIRRYVSLGADALLVNDIPFVRSVLEQA